MEDNADVIPKSNMITYVENNNRIINQLQCKINTLSDAITTLYNDDQRLRQKNRQLIESWRDDVTNYEASDWTTKIGSAVKKIISNKTCDCCGDKWIKLEISKAMMGQNFLEGNSHNYLRFVFINKCRKEAC